MKTKLERLLAETKGANTPRGRGLLAATRGRGMALRTKIGMAARANSEARRCAGGELTNEDTRSAKAIAAELAAIGMKQVTTETIHRTELAAIAKLRLGLRALEKQLGDLDIGAELADSRGSSEFARAFRDALAIVRERDEARRTLAFFESCADEGRLTIIEDDGSEVIPEALEEGKTL